MKEFLTFSDFELEVLRKLGIHPVANYFYHMQDKVNFVCKGASFAPIKDFGDDGTNYYTYEFKSKIGSIIFVRADHETSDYIPSLIIKFRDIQIAVGESNDNEPHHIIGDGESDTQKDIMKKMKSITVQMRNTRGNRLQSCIHFKPVVNDTISWTFIRDDATSEIPAATIEGTLDSARLSFRGKENEPCSYSYEHYKTLLEYTIRQVFEKEPRMQEIYLLLVTTFGKAYDASLYIPALFEETYQSRYTQAENDAKYRLKEELETIEHKRNNLSGIIQKYSIEKENQK